MKYFVIKQTLLAVCDSYEEAQIAVTEEIDRVRDAAIECVGCEEEILNVTSSDMPDEFIPEEYQGDGEHYWRAFSTDPDFVYDQRVLLVAE